MKSLGNAPQQMPLYRGQPPKTPVAKTERLPEMMMMRSKNLIANLRRSSKDVSVPVAVAVAGGRSKPNEGCKRHPKHKQSPGVCSLCLREKLSQLSDYSTSRCSTVASSCSSSSLSSLSSGYSSASASSYSSPMHRHPLLLFSGKNILTKSRSVAFASRLRSKEGKNKSGFLSKLLHPRNTKSNKEEDTGFKHSTTMGEILTTRVH